MKGGRGVRGRWLVAEWKNRENGKDFFLYKIEVNLEKICIYIFTISWEG